MRSTCSFASRNFDMRKKMCVFPKVESLSHMFISIFFLASEVRIVNERKYDQTGDDEEPSTR